MRLLVTFIAVCVAATALVAWRIAASVEHPGTAPQTALSDRAGQTRRSLPAQDKTPPAVLTPAALPPAGSVAPGTGPVAKLRVEDVAASAPRVPTSGPTTPQSVVRWADDRSRQELLRRLSAARAALTDDPYQPTALRDELSALRGLGRWAAAADTLARLVELNPEDTQRRYEYAEVLMRLERWMSAIRALRVVVQQDPGHVDAWYCLAAAQQALGHLQDARRSWDRVLARLPEDAAAYRQRGKVLLALHEWGPAAADFERALRHNPDEVAAVLELSLALSRSGRRPAARRCVLDILTRQPRCVPALNRLAEMDWEAYRLDPLGHRDQLQIVITRCRRSLEIDPQQSAVTALLTAALAASGE